MTRSGLFLAAAVTVAFAVAGCAASDDPADVADSGVDTATSAPTVPQPTLSPSDSQATTLAPGGPTPPSSTPPSTTPPSSAPEIGATLDLAPDPTVPLVLAHAGGDQDYPHSTMYAFSESAKVSDVLELDVRLSGDGVVIVHHDADTAKTTPERLVVADSDLAELTALDNAYWWSPECWPCQDLDSDSYPWRGVRTGERQPPSGYTPDDFRIVTLEEVSDRFPDFALDIEIKGDGEVGIAVAEALAAEIERLGRTDSVIVVSFSRAVIEAFHAAAPEVATPSVDELASWLLADQPLADHHDAFQVPPSYEGVEVLTPDNIAAMEAMNLPIWVWPNDASTQENETFYRQLVEMGVDGIIARPEQARVAVNIAR